MASAPPQTPSGVVYATSMDGWGDAVSRLLDGAGLARLLDGQTRILIKPNLVEAIAPPVTTPVALVASLVGWLQNHTSADILIGEGTGSISYPTAHCFDTLGYDALAARMKLELVDLNTQPLMEKRREDCLRWPSMQLPQLLDQVFLLSIPVLKAHSLAGVTLTMKNMMGCAPPSHYQHGGHWGKSSFHRRLQQAIADLNRYRTPDFTLLDATIGMSQAHLWGPHCEPPVGQLAASADPVAIDSYGCQLLQRDWRSIGHIALADGILGQAEPLTVHFL